VTSAHIGTQSPSTLNGPDFLGHESLRKGQLARLKAIAKLAWDKVEPYRARMQNASVTPDDIQSLDDIARLPFTVKTDLRDSYPFGLLAAPMSEVVRLHASSGTTGKPIVVAYTAEDMQVWTSTMVRAFHACGCHRGDVVQNAYGYGLFTGGLGFHYGAEALGATVIPVSGGNTDRQIMLMKDFGPTVVCSTPSYFVHIIERAGELGVDLRTLPLRVGLFGAEPWSNAMRRHMEKGAGIKAYDMYGLSEIAGPGIGAECCCQEGLHIFEDCYYPEIIDPATGDVLPAGQEGELVLTTLRKAAMPMIRYRTRDITSFVCEPCECGRTIRRIRRIGRRTDDMLIIRGVNVFPSQIESALLAIEGTLPHYELVLTRQGGLDRMEIRVEVTAKDFGDEIKALESLRSRISAGVAATVGIHAQVSLVEPHSIQRSTGKAKRVIDNRNV